MRTRAMKLSHAYLLLACLAALPAMTQASASIAAGHLSGTPAKAEPGFGND